MAISVYKTWISGEVLTAADLNNSFLQIVNGGLSLIFPATSSVDFDAHELILDGNGDTSITADTDDQIDFRLGGADHLVITTTDIKFDGVSLLTTTAAINANSILAGQVFGS